MNKKKPWMFQGMGKKQSPQSARGELFGHKTINVPNNGSAVDIHIKIGNASTPGQVGQVKKPKDWIQQINEF